MPGLKQMRQFIDESCSDKLSNRFGWLFDCSSSCGNHVVISFLFLRKKDDSDISDVRGKFLRQSFMSRLLN